MVVGEFSLLGMLGCSKQSDMPTVDDSVTRETSTSEASTSEASTSESGVTSEPSFDEALARVRSGEAIAIRMTKAKITAEQLLELSSVSERLLELQLDAGIVDDDSIAAIANLEALEHLRLRESPITDAGIAKLDPVHLPELKILNLPQASLTLAGLEHLARFPSLVQLRLSASKFDDRAAEVLASFPSLRSLHLIGPKFTDVALEHLANAPKLSSLYIDDCHLSDAAWQKLFQAKPNLHVHIDQHHHDRDPNADH